MTGKERDFRQLISGQETKIEATKKKMIGFTGPLGPMRTKIHTCEEKIKLYKKQLERYLKDLNPPIELPPDTHDYCGKILYTSEDAARTAMGLINRDLIKYGKRPIRRAYFCNQCEAWHLTRILEYNERVSV